MPNTKFRIIESDLITCRTDQLILNTHEIYIGRVTPSALDYLDGNIQIEIEPITFDRVEEGTDLVIGYYGVGHYYPQIGTVTTSLYSAVPRELLRQDTFGENGVTELGGVVDGFLFIGEPDDYNRRKVAYRGRWVSSNIVENKISSQWLDSIKGFSPPNGALEIVVEAYSDPFEAIDSFSLSHPNMPGIHTATLDFGSGDYLCSQPQ